MKTTAKKLVTITESYPANITAFALNNACTQLILSSDRYEHLRKGVNKNAIKLAEEFLSESKTFFEMSAELESEEKSMK